MMNRVLQIRVEDHVSPVLNAISDMRLTFPTDASLPDLPADLVVLELHQRHARASVTMRPSPAILQWLADLRELAIR